MNPYTEPGDFNDAEIVDPNEFPERVDPDADTAHGLHTPEGVVDAFRRLSGEDKVDCWEMIREYMSDYYR